MPKLIIMLNGPDAEKAFQEMMSNIQYDKLDVDVWTFEPIELGAAIIFEQPTPKEDVN